PALLLGRGDRFVVLLPGRVAPGLLFARGFLLLGPPAVGVEGALWTGRVVRSRGRGRLGRIVLFPGIGENRRGLGWLVAFGLRSGGLEDQRGLRRPGDRDGWRGIGNCGISGSGISGSGISGSGISRHGIGSRGGRLRSGDRGGRLWRLVRFRTPVSFGWL